MGKKEKLVGNIMGDKEDSIKESNQACNADSPVARMIIPRRWVTPGP